MTTYSETTILVDGEQTTVREMAQANAENQEILEALREIENGAASVDLDLGAHGIVHIAKVVKEPSCDCGTRSEQHADACELVAEGFI
jgi:hypothetical protein